MQYYQAHSSSNGIQRSPTVNNV